MNKLSIILLTIGTILLALTLILGWLIIPGRAKSKIGDRLQLINGSQTWDKWAHITSPIFLRVYIFHTTNPSEVKMGGKPKLTEYGPYVFEERRVKTNISLHAAGQSVSYRQSIYYYFRPQLSNGSLSDRMTVLNVPFLSLTTLGVSQGVTAQFVLQYSVLSEHEDETLFVTRTVDQLLFKGYHVPLIQTLEEVTGRSPLVNNTFGFYFPKNGSDNGLMQIKTGLGHPDQFGQMVSWNGEKNLDFWHAQTCNQINGSDGSLFPPFLEKGQRIPVFISDFCRSLDITFKEETEHNGIRGYRFIIPKETMSYEGDNACFCQNEEKRFCPEPGIFKLAACRKGAPVVMSFPHFLDGSPSYQNSCVGLTPDRNRHETFLDLEPNTGAMIRARKRGQVNFQLEPNTLSEEFYHVPSMIYPVLWIDEEASMALSTQDQIKNLIIKPLTVVNIGKWIFVGLSCLLISTGLILHLVKSQKGQQKYSPGDEKSGKFEPTVVPS